ELGAAGPGGGVVVAAEHDRIPPAAPVAQPVLRAPVGGEFVLAAPPWRDEQRDRYGPTFELADQVDGAVERGVTKAREGDDEARCHGRMVTGGGDGATTTRCTPDDRADDLGSCRPAVARGSARHVFDRCRSDRELLLDGGH